MSHIAELLRQIDDIRRQVEALARLDVVETPASILGTQNTFTANNAFNSTATTGSAISVTRNLTATSTDSPVVNIVQDHASDDQDALRIQQDGTGEIVELLDGGTVVLRLRDGGRLDVYNIIRALTASGLIFQDDGGNVAVTVEDGGLVRVGVGGATAITALHVSPATGNTPANIPLQLDRTTSNTTGVVTSGKFVAISTGNMADTFGPIYNFYIQDTAAVENLIARFGAVRDGADNSGSFVIYTTDAGSSAERMRVSPIGHMGIMVTAPRGPLHIHDGTGGMLFVTKTGIDGTAQTIIPNGTGDVAGALYFSSVVRTSGGSVFGTSNVIALSGNVDIYNSGGNTLNLRVNGDGSVDVRRTAGALTYTVVIHMVWL